ncbi:MAG: ATP-dependent Clp protease proteolytic subunit [Patescibacteria group bacterium]|nr:ATP-dependent Clp protease proteolytic subunit [Patescibacteria group bacterium]
MKVPLKIVPERSLHLPREFTEKDAELLISKLFELNQSKGDIFLQINSGGGSFAGAQKLYDNIVMSPNPVIGLVIGDCFSAASMVLQACSKRYASKHSRLLIHHVSYPVRFTFSHKDTIEKVNPMILGELERIERNNKVLISILESKFLISTEQIIKLMDKEQVITPVQALEIGFIDELL